MGPDLLLATSHLHAACEKEKPSGTGTMITEWITSQALDFPAAEVAPVGESVLEAPELSLRRRFVAGAVADRPPVCSEDMELRVERRIDICTCRSVSSGIPLSISLCSVVGKGGAKGGIFI